jgi:DNA-binding NarL/FixJ family response regulator
LAPIVRAHHEHADGSGYYRGLTAEQTPLEARVLSVAARFDELLHPADAEARTPAVALEALRAEGTWHDAMVVRALEGATGAPSRAPARTRSPAGLTEREIEVLRLAARGMTRRAIATRLGLTENTVRHHLDHIYDKVGVSNRVAAAMFAMEQGLLE